MGIFCTAVEQEEAANRLGAKKLPARPRPDFFINFLLPEFFFILNKFNRQFTYFIIKGMDKCSYFNLYVQVKNHSIALLNSSTIARPAWTGWVFLLLPLLEGGRNCYFAPQLLVAGWGKIDNFFLHFHFENLTMKFNLKGKSAIVTGGGSGIGKAISIALAGNGAQVHILELQEEQGKETVMEIAKNGGQAKSYTCNVAEQDAVKNTINAIAQSGQIDILVNNAGIAHIGNVETTQEADLDKIYTVNIKGIYNCIHVAIPFMRQKGGVIINMASVASSLGIADRFAYSMSKGAVLTMTYSVAKDYLDYGIRCNSISPGRVHTPFVDGFIAKNYPGQEKEMFEKLSKTQPIGRMGAPEEIGNLALYLCSDEASFITGTDFPIDGGFTKLNS